MPTPQPLTDFSLWINAAPIPGLTRLSRLLKMEKFFILSCFFGASLAFFFPFINLPNQRRSMMNVCIYSVNPVQYQPKCFLCPSSVYPNVVRACVNAASIPSNITFTQARCIEQNCAITRGRRSVDIQQPDNLLEEYEAREPIDPRNDDTDQHSHDVEPERPNNPQVVGTEEFFASDYADDEEGSDYAELDE